MHKSKLGQIERLEIRQLMHGGDVNTVDQSDLLDPDSLPTGSPNAIIAQPIFGNQTPSQPTNIYLDFGFAFNGAHSTGQKVLFSDYTSPDFGVADADKKGYLPSLPDSVANEGVDIDGDGQGGTLADAQALAEDVLKIVRRMYQPFNVNVEIANSANWDEIAATVTATETNDAYVIIAGEGADFGAAPYIDFQHGGKQFDPYYLNLRDDVVFAFAETIAQSSGGLNAVALARTAAHEAAHSFGLGHLLETPEVSTNGLMVQTTSTAKFNTINTVFRGWSMETTPEGNAPVPWKTQDDYLWLAHALGLRPEAPAYVSGTSLHDKITLTDIGGGWANVTVEAYLDAQHQDYYKQVSYTVPLSHGVLIEAGAGDDVVDATSLAANVIVLGGDGNDLIKAGSGDDVLDGESGHDELRGGAGNDSLEGGSGDDQLRGGRDDDVYVFASRKAKLGNDTIKEDDRYAIGPFAAGPGIDTLDFSGFNAPVTVDLSQAGATSNTEYQVVGDGIELGLRFLFADRYMWTPASSGIENVIGSRFDDDITGNLLNNRLEGGDGEDTIRGGDGNDTLVGGDMDDRLFGDDGLDQLFGEAGRDFLDGGADDFSDMLVGGSGRDEFVQWYGRTAEENEDFLYRFDSLTLAGYRPKLDRLPRSL